MEPAEFFRPGIGADDGYAVRAVGGQRIPVPAGRYLEFLSPRLDLPS
jgi:hypothetical protein